ncbi:hypothetical protein MCOR27_004412 [Pyricularia oryzae]|uniref:Uncharacterized protein n=5 Tax=Pyricularia TaxID=48558 RepID=A0ABQ8NV34_PYRGI|nr:uncharacterized protein MGG_02485 [Pyricularia oryzae 70-15]ELQ35183.1 hypothetical protein OOU_Y34scaffold00725g41 [Pyricularia oryzae Y34]KAH8842560.1 hypothetical protein MCOR01_006465 [Pyricularia oryzae]KAI6302555.1 hypothetical protein MCOR33_002143 [Pyricularia grisea]EHA56669.1 hypothetical protein MGG_02485 [Pyricularia oryzae 70-15]KAH9435809.1 hypothetical protein MCOR02_004728 [Pyricularia oryzae]
MNTPRATTPEQSHQKIKTPDTPRWGFADPWEPYDFRPSTRIQSQSSSSKTIDRKANRTPSPANSRSAAAPRSPRFTVTRASPQKRPAMDLSELPASPTKKHAPLKRDGLSSTMLSGEVGSSSLFGPPSAQKKAPHMAFDRTDISEQTGMLPTPSKTPSRKHSKQLQADINAVSRNLFNDDDIMPQPKTKRPTKYSGISMGSFTAVESEDPIDIFTDSHDRIPVVDDDAENPFIDGPSQGRSQRLAARQRRNEDLVARTSDAQVHLAEGGVISLKEARERSEEGFIQVFRGKRIFHQDTRGKKLKGRLLFASASAAKSKTSPIFDEDEEAETDIEDHVDSQVENKLDIDDEISAEPSSSTLINNEGVLATPKVKVDKKVTTPIVPAAPHSPPATGRLLRSSRRSAEETPAHKPRKPSSPFDGWARVKGSIDTRSTSSKRPATPTSPHADAKRPRF